MLLGVRRVRTSKWQGVVEYSSTMKTLRSFGLCVEFNTLTEKLAKVHDSEDVQEVSLPLRSIPFYEEAKGRTTRERLERSIGRSLSEVRNS